MAGYFINASALCTLLNLEDYAGDDTACVYSMLKEFHKTWTTSVQFGGLKAFEKFEVNRGTYWATRPFLQSAKIVEAWGHLLERCATCRTTQDLAETRAAAMQVLTSNAYLTDLLKVVEGRLKAMPQVGWNAEGKVLLAAEPSGRAPLCGGGQEGRLR